MNDAKRDRAHAYICIFCLAAKVEVVKMKIEPLVEMDRVCFENGFLRGEQQAVEKLALLARLSVHR